MLLKFIQIFILPLCGKFMKTNFDIKQHYL